MKLLFTLVLGMALGTSTLVAKDLAKVGGKAITEKEFIEAADALGPRGRTMLKTAGMRKQFLEHLIESRLLSELAKKEGVEKSKVYQMRIEEAERQILANLYTEQYISKETTDKKLEEYFAKNKESFSDKKVKARHILLEKEEDAKKILAEAQKKDADFAKLAETHSSGPSAKSGGDLGFFGRGQMVKEFEDAAFDLKPGTIYPKPVQTRFGFHIIKVEEVQGGDTIKFEDAKDKVKGQLERDLRANLIEDLKKQAKVEILDQNLESLEL